MGDKNPKKAPKKKATKPAVQAEQTTATNTTKKK